MPAWPHVRRVMMTISADEKTHMHTATLTHSVDTAEVARDGRSTHFCGLFFMWHRRPVQTLSFTRCDLCAECRRSADIVR